jgi:hypothetical protein
MRQSVGKNVAGEDCEETKNNAKNMKKAEEEICPNECVTSDLFGGYNRKIT